MHRLCQLHLIRPRQTSMSDIWNQDGGHSPFQEEGEERRGDLLRCGESLLRDRLQRHRRTGVRHHHVA
jgi:hypothetical protein